MKQNAVVAESPIAAPAGTLAERVMVLQLTFRTPGSRRKIASKDVVKEGEGDNKIDAGSIKAQKEILRSRTLTRIVSRDAKIRAQIRKLGTPCEYVSDGYEMVPLPFVNEITALLDEYTLERQHEAEHFVSEEYDDLKRDARERLGPAYNEDDYDSHERMLARFGVSYRWVAFDIPKTLKAINRAVYEREVEKMVSSLEGAEQQIKAALTQEFQGMVEHMVDRLTPTADGRTKVFRNTLTENLAEFLRTYRFRNVVGDDKLPALVEQARSLLQGIDADSLRDSERNRLAVQRGFAAIKARLDALVEDEPERALDLS